MPKQRGKLHFGVYVQDFVADTVIRVGQRGSDEAFERSMTLGFAAAADTLFIPQWTVDTRGYKPRKPSSRRLSSTFTASLT